MLKNKIKIEEKKIPTAAELSINTKKTLKDYIKVNTFAGFATGLVAGVTLFATPLVEDKQKKITLGITGAVLTAASVGMIGASFNRMDGFIEDHDDTVKLEMLGRFLDAKDAEGRDELIDTILNELHPDEAMYLK